MCGLHFFLSFNLLLVVYCFTFLICLLLWFVFSLCCHTLLLCFVVAPCCVILIHCIVISPCCITSLFHFVIFFVLCHLILSIYYFVLFHHLIVLPCYFALLCHLVASFYYCALLHHPTTLFCSFALLCCLVALVVTSHYSHLIILHCCCACWFASLPFPNVVFPIFHLFFLIVLIFKIKRKPQFNKLSFLIIEFWELPFENY
jgi:hypothetical protein